MRTLPSRPSLYLEIMRELRPNNANAKVVGELVSKDLAISTKLIQVVNSAYYGLAQQVTEPSDAVLLLGLDTTASLVLSIEAFARFDKVKPLYFSIDQIWKHSQALAQAAKKITEVMTHDYDLAKDAFTAGLLHDIGKLTLALNFEEQYQGALKLAEKRKLPACEVESEVFGASHAEAGAYLLSLWGLPFPIIEAVASHHLPAVDIGSKFTAATAVHLAERLENEYEMERNGGDTSRIDLNYPSQLGVETHLEELRRIIRGEDKPGTPGTTFYVKRPTTPLPPQPTKAEPDHDPETPVLAAPSSPVPIVIPASEPIKYSVKSEGVPKTRVAFVVTGICIIIFLLIVGTITTFRTVAAAVTPARPATKVAKNLAQPSTLKRPVRNTVQPEKPAPVAEKPVEPAPTPAPSTTPQHTPEQQAQETFAKLKVQAIMYHGVESSVLINGTSLKLGETIEGARIFSVEPLAVTLEKDGFQRKYKLN